MHEFTCGKNPSQIFEESSFLCRYRSLQIETYQKEKHQCSQTQLSSSLCWKHPVVEWILWGAATWPACGSYTPQHLGIAW